MIWQKYDLVFRLLAPIHVGRRKVSNLQQTRGYVPGKLFWAALTARLTREAGKGADGRAYQETGTLVQKHYCFTYLYPAISKMQNADVKNSADLTTHYPWEDGFDYLFLDSHASTALNYTSKSAEDAMLHETEFIAPRTRTNQPVYLSGSLYVKDNLPDELQKWQEILDKLQFGGERGYGWGRVQLAACDEKEIVDNNEVQITLPANGRITAHLETENLNGLAVAGPIEPLIGWERNNGNGANWRLSKAAVCYAPGAVISENATFTIGKNGRWHLHNS